MDYTGHLTLRSLLPGPTTGVSYQSLLVPFKHVSLYLNHTHTHTHTHTHSVLGSSAGKEPACNVGDPSSITGLGRTWRSDRLPTPVFLGFPGGSDGKEFTCNAGDLSLIPGLGRSPGGGHGNPLHLSFLKNLHGQRNLEGYSPWGCKEADVTKHSTDTHTHTQTDIHTHSRPHYEHLPFASPLHHY